MQQLKADEPFYQINQAAKLIGITSDRLRTYEEEGLIKPYRTKNTKDGKRLFSNNDIEWLTLIRDLIKLGVSIPAIRVLVRANFSKNNSDLPQKDKEIVKIVKRLKQHPVYNLTFK